nr:hypothetical protein BaRGS_004692 [Batillaria attramentaria]
MLMMGQTISELADQLGKDVILEDVVLDQLASQSDHMCVSCPNKAAIKLCLDCGETYLEANITRLQEVKNKLEVQQQLLATYVTRLAKPDDVLLANTRSMLPRLREIRENCQPGQTISELADQLGKDVILEDVVLDQLASQSDHMCVSCPNKAAIKLCLDCGETYLEANITHLQEVKNKLEVQQQLLTTYVTRLAKPDDALLANTRSMLPRLREIRENCQPGQTISELADQLGKDVILEDVVLDQLASQSDHMCVSCPNKAAIKLCLDCGETYLEANITRLQEVKNKLEVQQQLLETYVTRLAKPDDVLLANTRSMLPRLREIRENCQPGQTISELADQLGKDLILEDVVLDQLASQSDYMCVSCPNKAAIKLCLDCAETYLEANITRLQEVKNKLEVQQQLLATYVTRLSKPDDVMLANTRSMLPRLREIRENCQPGQTISELADQLGKDVILEDVVLDQLASQSDYMCVSCPNKPAIKLCLDCAETYLEANITHLQEVKNKLEVQQQLLATYVTRLAKPDDVLLANTRSMLPRLREIRENCQPGQTISELADQLGKDLILEDVVLDQLASQSDHTCVSCPNKAAIKLCLDCAETYLEANITRLQEVKNKLEVQQQLLETYVTRLAKPDDALLANTRSMLPRLRTYEI